MTSDHYELLGVEPSASKDEIKAAYRAEIANADSAQRAELNRAWNVLSDPMQRERYDAARMVGDDVDDADEFAEHSPVKPTRKLTGARRGPETTEVVGTGKNSSPNGSNGSGSGESSKGAGEALPKGARPPAVPTVELPPGMNLAPKRQRGFSIGFDVAVLAILYILFVSVVIPAVLRDQYPHRMDRIDAITDQTKKLDDQKSAAEDRESKANDRADAAKKSGNDSARTAARQDAADAKKTATARDREITRLDNEASDLQGKMIGTSYLLLGLLLILALLYLVPSTALTGQTLGKKINKVWLVRLDGSRVGWGTALAHCAVPVVIALAVPQIGPIVALGMVFWALRDRNEQGLHDKLAKTLVVDTPPGD
jgi:curved DNA-binding protein CbpA